MNIYLSIGGFTIEIDFIQIFHKKTQPIPMNKLQKILESHLRGFILHKKPHMIDMRVKMYDRTSAIFYKRKGDTLNKFLHFYQAQGNVIKTYQSLSNNQFMFLLIELLQRLLVQNEGFILHASAIQHEGKAILFTGKPCAGKSTIMTLLSDAFPPLADDSQDLRTELI